MLLYKFRDMHSLHWVADILIRERLYCAEYYKLNDPFEGVAIQLGQVIDPDTQADPEIDQCPRVCSLSASFKDIRLWSLYGGAHRGIAIEIEFPEEEKGRGKVTYTHKLKVWETNVAPRPRHLLYHKTRHWLYEKEHRIITEEPYYSVQGRIRRILLGPLCKEESREILHRLKPPGTQLVRTKLDMKTLDVIVAGERHGQPHE